GGARRHGRAPRRRRDSGVDRARPDEAGHPTGARRDGRQCQGRHRYRCWGGQGEGAPMTVTPGGAGGTGGAEGSALSKAARGNSHGASKRAVDVEALRREIAHTRAELGETMQALAAKADVKARLQETADEARARVRERLQNAV